MKTIVELTAEEIKELARVINNAALSEDTQISLSTGKVTIELHIVNTNLFNKYQYDNLVNMMPKISL